MSLKPKGKKRLLLAGGLLAAPLMLAVWQMQPRAAQSSDHADTAENASRMGADLTDLYIFPSPQNANNVVLVMDVHSLNPPGATVSFDPNVLYQFKIDTNGDAIEDKVIQAKFGPAGANQTVQIAGPLKPSRTGSFNRFETANAVSGTINQTFSPTAGMQVFAGLREDPFFIDLERFTAVNPAVPSLFPDRATPLTPPLPRVQDKTIPNPNTPAINPPSWRPPGQARDFLTNINTLCIVIELPKSRLAATTQSQS